VGSQFFSEEGVRVSTSVDQQVTERVWTPPLQSAEHELHEPANQLYDGGHGAVLHDCHETGMGVMPLQMEVATGTFGLSEE